MVIATVGLCAHLCVRYEPTVAITIYYLTRKSSVFGCSSNNLLEVFKNSVCFSGHYPATSTDFSDVARRA